MPYIRSYEDAIIVLKEVKRDLKNLKGELDKRLGIYKGHIEMAKSNQWMEDYITILMQNYMLLEREILVLKKAIDILDSQIEKDIGHIVQLAKAASEREREESDYFIRNRFSNFTAKYLNGELVKEDTKRVIGINPKRVMMPQIDDGFWKHHGNDKERYIDLVKRYHEAVKYLDEGKRLEDNPVLDKAYRVFKNEPIRLVELDGYYMVEENGRHRVAAAKELNISIEAEVVTYKDKQNNQ
jgi:hypothetical protein